MTHRSGLVVLALTLVVAGCSAAVTTPLPELGAPGKSVMSSAEQERAIKDMMARKDDRKKAEDDIARQQLTPR
jgi:hypothetical protein